jgi:GTP cyclohydrolase I
MDAIEELYSEILQHIGEVPSRSGLCHTPRRAAKALRHLTKGYRQNAEEIVNDAIFSCVNDEMVLVRDIAFYSLSEQNFLPFTGECHVAYLPSGKVIGLSKIARLVDMLAHRLQLQENLTVQIAETLAFFTHAHGVAVVIEAVYPNTAPCDTRRFHTTTTLHLLGSFRDNACLRSEFWHMLGKTEGVLLCQT